MPQPFFIEAFVDTGLRKVAHLKMLKRRGYHNVLQAEGGITQWQMRRYEVVKDE